MPAVSRCIVNRVRSCTETSVSVIAEIRRLKQLEEENTKLKRLVADLSLDKTMLQDVLRKKF